ncbi:MAG: hypothetical protein H7Y01_08485 [Ferruginibacter sp.]|nr:hypothetical protein [Chitinophagaceae bacterium]
MLFPWLTETVFGYGWKEVTNINGYRNWGFLTLAGSFGVAIAMMMGDKLKVPDQNTRMLAIASFSAIIIGVVVTLLTEGGTKQYTNTLVDRKTAFGIWFPLVTGAAGILVVTGIIKIPENSHVASNPHNISHQQFSPPPPPPSTTTPPPVSSTSPPPPPTTPVS